MSDEMLYPETSPVVARLRERMFQQHGRVDCDDCGGLGTTWATDICETCFGSGEIPANWRRDDGEDAA